MPSRSFAVPLRRIAIGLLWLVLGLIFFGIGLQKLTAYEAQAIRPFAATSPFLGFWYDLLGTRGASRLFGVVEIVIGIGLLSGLVRPGGPAARLGAFLAAGTAFVTSSFLLTAPGVLAPGQRLPLLSLEVGQLFVKDLVLFAAALLLLAESLSARR